LKEKMKKKRVGIDKIVDVCPNYFAQEFKLPTAMEIPQKQKQISKEKEKSKGSKGGRPKTTFEMKKARSKFYEAAELRQNYPSEAIKLAFKQSIKAEAKKNVTKKDFAFVMKKCDSATGLTASKAKEAISSHQTLTPKTPEEALFFVLSNGLTKQQYKNLKTASRNSQADIWPNYEYVREAKNNLRPDQISVVEDKSILVPLQELLNHTVQRTLQSNNLLFEKLLDFADENGKNLVATLIYKFGFDSSGSHEVWQQPDSVGDHRTVKHLMSTQMSPLQIIAEVDGTPKVLFDYPNRNSPNSCRPIRLSFEVENHVTILKEYERLQLEVKNIRDYQVHDNPKVTFNYQGLFTLIDGKVLSAITGISSACCPQCGKGPTELRKRHGDFEPISGNLEFGLSILHFGIRTSETLLKIGYKQHEKKFTARESKTDPKQFKEKIEKVKETVRKRFKDELGLIVDKARPGSFGSTNTGNVARKIFDNPVVTASICGVSTLLVSNLACIWKTLASGYKIRDDKFEKFCQETLDIYFDEELGAPWYPMPPSLHRVLVHGSDIIRACPVPIGLTSEECSEANNKFARKFEQHHTRKLSHDASLVDLFHRLTDISDPKLVASTRQEKVSSLSKIPADMKKLIFFSDKDSNSNNCDDEENSSGNSSGEDSFHCSTGEDSN
jgi:hypothetical protein